MRAFHTPSFLGGTGYRLPDSGHMSMRGLLAHDFEAAHPCQFRVVQGTEGSLERALPRAVKAALHDAGVAKSIQH